MKKTILYLCLVAALLALACKKTQTPTPTGEEFAKPSVKNPVMVVIDIDRILKEAKLSQEISSELQAWGDGMKNQIQAKISVFQQKQEVFKNTGEGLSPAARSAKIQELQALQQEVQQMQNQAQQELERRQEAAAKKMRDQFDPLMEAIAKQNGWDVVLNKADQVTVWSSGALDQTDFVIKRLNAMHGNPPTPPAAGTPAQSPSAEKK